MKRSSYGTKYPIVLVHGIAAKKLRILNASGKIGNKLEEAGNAVFIAHRQKTKALPPVGVPLFFIVEVEL